MRCLYKLRNTIRSLTQSALSGADDSLSTIGYLELAKNVRHIVAYRVWAQYQASSNLRIAVALCNQVEDLTLTFRQLREGLRRYSGSGSCEQVDQAGSNGGAEDGFASA